MRLELQHVRLPLMHFTLELDLDLESDSIGLFGESGSGKTSFLDLLAGTRAGAKGTVRLDGATLQSDSLFVRPNRRAIGYVPQDLALFPHLSVRENIYFGAGRKNSERSIRPEHVIDLLDLGKLLARRIDRLSGGEKQRVAIARAIVSRPKLILLDEPFTGLDPKLRTVSVELVHRLRTEFSIPILCVSHSRHELDQLCDLLIELAAGKVVSCFPGKP